MADEPYMNNSLKGGIAITALVFNAGIIVSCVVWGDGHNSLHASALAWSYMLGAGILLGLGIGTLAPGLLEAFKGGQK